MIELIDRMGLKSILAIFQQSVAVCMRYFLALFSDFAFYDILRVSIGSILILFSSSSKMTTHSEYTKRKMLKAAKIHKPDHFVEADRRADGYY